MDEGSVEVQRKRIEIDTVFIPDYPLMIYYLPSGSPGKFIRVDEDPYYGVTTTLIDEKDRDKPPVEEDKDCLLDKEQLFKAVKTMLQPLCVEEHGQHDAVASTIALFISAKAKEMAR